jgi:hypothetical protein
MCENSPAPTARRIVEITDEHETLLIALVPVGPQFVLLPVNQTPKGKPQ